jgi:hypothetical protein
MQKILSSALNKFSENLTRVSNPVHYPHLFEQRIYVFFTSNANQNMSSLRGTKQSAKILAGNQSRQAAIF